MFHLFSIFLLILNFCYAEILDKNLAFNINLHSVDGGFEASINFDKSVYLYANKLKIYAKDIEINNFLDIGQAIKYENNLIHNNNFNIFIPQGLLQNYADNNKLTILIAFQGCSYSGFCYAPMRSSFDIDLKNKNIDKKLINETIEQTFTIKNKQNANDEIFSDYFKNKNIILVLIIFFGYGLLLSLTPCVLPMLPILSAIILTKINKNKKQSLLSALIYVFSVSITNAIFGVIAAKLGASIQAYLQKPIVIIISAVIFVVLSFLSFGVKFSFLSGITSTLNNKMQAYSGYFGIVMMGILSALVISPCVAAPLAGVLLYIANSADMVFGALALFTLSLGMGMPLILLGAGFKFLPKPGNWMQKITQIFGFIMLAMAIWLLSRILDESIIMLCYGILGIFACIFLFDFKIPSTFTQKIYLSCLIIVFIISVAMIFSFMLGFNTKTSNNISQEDYKSASVQIKNLNELNSLINSTNKPVLIDFWASWCQNCKEFDKVINSDTNIKNLVNKFQTAVVDLSIMTKENQEILNKFSIFGPPAFLFFTDSQLRYKVVATPKKDEFVKLLNEFINF